MAMITTKICPNCGSEEVYMIAGGITGTWMCKKCGYTGPVFEKEIIESTSFSRRKPSRSSKDYNKSPKTKKEIRSKKKIKK